MDDPLISILIPVFNQGKIVLETLNSVRQQSYQNWECIIIDDGSTDNTPEIIKKYIKRDSRFQFFERDRLPKGGSVCRNIALSCATGEYVMFLDSDDLIIPECLEGRMDKAKTNPGFDLWVFRTGVFHKEIGDSQKVLVAETNIDPLYLFLRHSRPLPWHTMGPLWRSRSLLELGGFNENYPRLQDPELHTRALLNGLKVYVESKTVDNYYRQPLRSKRTSQLSIEEQRQKATVALIGASYYYQDVIRLSKDREDLVVIRKELGRMYSHFFKLYHTYIYELKPLYWEQLSLLRKNGAISLFKYKIYEMALKYPFLTRTKGIRGFFWRLY